MTKRKLFTSTFVLFFFFFSFKAHTYIVTKTPHLLKKATCKDLVQFKYATG